MRKIVAIAISTGGPKALQCLLPALPMGLDAPVVVVQHMTEGFTAPLSQRLNEASELKVCEAKEGDVVEAGQVYIAKAGMHLTLQKRFGQTVIHYVDAKHREGVKPCANYLFESLVDCDYDENICIVMTGMGSDGAEGIKKLKEVGKKTYVITQSSDSCVVNGMPNSCIKAGLSDVTLPLEKIAQQVISLCNMEDR